MNQQTILAAIAAFALVATFAIMADCSKQVSRTGSEAVEACVKRGGAWIGNNDGLATGLDICVEKRHD
jgi:hypothetical protein